jgi:hypothetical protein
MKPQSETRKLECTVGSRGFAGVTPVCIRELTDKERTMDLKPGEKRRPKLCARVGFAVMGSTNMYPEEFDACDHDPFHDKFEDNYVEAFGDTDEECVEELKNELNSFSGGLFH